MQQVGAGVAHVLLSRLEALKLYNKAVRNDSKVEILITMLQS